MSDLGKLWAEKGYLEPLEQAQDTRGEFRKGATGALENTLSGFKALGGRITGNYATQLDAITDMQESGMRNAPEVGTIEDINGIGDFGKWLGYNLGSGTASIGTMVAGGGLPGLAVKGLAKGALVNSARSIGAGAAGFTPNYGESLNNAYQETGNIEGAAAFTAASIKTALDVFTPLKILRKSGGAKIADNVSEKVKMKLVNDNRFKSAMLDVAKTSGTEAITEAAQSYVDQVTLNVLTEEANTFGVRDWSELVNSAAAGAAGSLGFGAYGGLQTSKQAGALRQQSEQQNNVADEIFNNAPSVDSQVDAGDTVDLTQSARPVEQEIQPDVNYDIPTAARNAGVENNTEMFGFGNEFVDNAQMRQRSNAAQENALVPQGEPQDWQPNFTMPEQQMGLQPLGGNSRSQVAPYTYEGEFEPRRDEPRPSVPVGQVLESPVIDGEFERQRALTDRSNMIYGEDGRDLKLSKAGTPFATEKALKLSKGYKNSVKDGNEPRVVKVDGGFAWEANIAEQKIDQVGTYQSGTVTEQVPQNKIMPVESAEVATELPVTPVDLREPVSKTPVVKPNAVETASVTEPEILNKTKSQWVKAELNKQSIKKASPGFDSAKASIEEQYEKSLDDAYAQVSFERYNDLNKDIPESINRSAYKAIREEKGLSAPVETKVEKIDIAANEAATSPTNDLPQPTEAQKEAGNYKKGKVKIQGLDISIENPKGSERTGIDTDGKKWSTKMNHHYGDIKKTNGADGDPIDVFIGEKTESEKVFVVDQNDVVSGQFDEHKVMIGFDSIEDAKKGYLSNYSKNFSGFGEITETSMSDFKEWVAKPRKSKQPFAKPAETKKAETPKEVIDDFGEKLEGAKKDIAKNWNSELSESDIESMPLSKIWPKDLFTNLDSKFAEAFAFSARNEIPNKPRRPHLVKAWVKKVTGYKNMMNALIVKPLERDERTNKPKLLELMKGKVPLEFTNKVELLESIDKENWPRIGVVRIYSKANGFEVDKPIIYVSIDKRNVSIEADSIEAALPEISKRLKGEDKSSRMKFDVRGQNGSYAIYKSGDKEYRPLKTFASTKEAFAYRDKNYDEVVNLWDKIKERDNVSKGDTRSNANQPREGIDYRNGRDVTPTEFEEAFGFRGVQFGNWVGKKEERQQSLNQAYDALNDLASIVGVPTKGISLEGKLGLAFGARGSGKAMAHYESGTMVINLTKTKGAGSLAHEWFHALDHYFMQKRGDRDGLPANSNTFITYQPEAMYIHKTQAMGKMTKAKLEARRARNPKAGIFRKEDWILDPDHKKGVRVEIESRFANLVEQLEASDMSKRSMKLDKTPDKYWSQIIEKAARAFEVYVITKMEKRNYSNDYLANVVSETEFVRDIGRYPYLLKKEIEPVEQAFDTLFETMETKKDDSGNVILFNKSTKVVKNGVPLAQAKAETKKFVDYFKGVKDKGFDQIITDKKPSEIFGPSVAKDDNFIKGAFDPATNRLFIFSQNHEGSEDVRRTLREELLVHKGLGLLQEKEVSELFSAINGTRESTNPAIQKIWKDIDKNYAKETELVQAEEFLGKVAQDKPKLVGKYWNNLVAAITKIMRKMGLVKPGITLPEMREVVYEIGDKLSKGQRSQVSTMQSKESGDIRFNRVMESAKDKLGLSSEGPDSIVDRIKSSLSKPDFANLKERATEGIFDSLLGIKKAEEAAGITPENQGYITARLAAGVGDVVHATMFHGAPEWREGIVQRKADSKGLLEVFGQLDETQLNDWLGWVSGNRANQLMQEGRENNLTQSEIDELMQLSSGREELFNKVLREYNVMNSAVLDMAEESGLLNKDVRAKFDSEYYVPFFREDESTGDVVASLFTNAGIANQSANLKKLKGSKLKTKDILENILSRHAKTIEASMKNKAMLEVTKNLEGTDVMQEVRLNAIEIQNVYKKSRNQRDYVSVIDDGETKWYVVGEPSLMRALMQINTKPDDNILNKVGRAAKRFLTIGVTMSPEFILRNFIRDSAQAWMINKDGFKGGIDSVKGAVKTWKNDENTLDIMFAGASFQGGYVHANDPEAASQQIRRALRKKGMNESQVSKYLASIPKNTAEIFEKYREVSDSMENANRVSTYARAIEAGKSKKVAAFEAKDFMDFSLQGNFTAIQWLIDMLPFFNARLQGLYKLGREMKSKPNDEVLKILSKQVATKGMYIAAFSMALAMVNEDNEEYKGVADWDKDANWHLFFGDTHIRIPKPFELGILFGTIPERMFGAASGNQDGDDIRKSAWHAITSTLAFNPMPQVAMPAVEYFANYSFFTGSDIDSMGDLRKRPQDRYGMYTTETAKLMGEAFGASPKKVEHLIRGYFGTLGAYALAASDFIANSAAVTTGNGEFKYNEFDDLSVVRAFAKYKEPGGQYYTEQFYDMLKDINGVYGQYKIATEERDLEAAQEIMKDGKVQMRFRSKFNRTVAAMNKLNNQRNLIWKNPNLSRSEREDRVDEIQIRKVALARRLVVEYKAYR